MILDHYRHPRHRERLADPDACARVLNSVCGDEVEVEVTLQAGRICEVSSRSRGCSIAVAAGSVMSEVVQGLSVADVRILRDRLAKLVRGEQGVEAMSELDERILAFSRIAEVPARERCALLPWEALTEALERCS